MSNYWRLACRTCDEESGMDGINHGDKTVRAMIRVGRHLRDVDDDEALVDLQLTVDGRTAPLWFIWAHREHDLVARSEYGEEKTG